MSARWLGWAWGVPLVNVGGSTPATQQLVLVALVDQAGERTGRVNHKLSVARIAAMTRLSRSSVVAALNALAVQGVIVAPGGRSGGRVPTRWILAPALEGRGAEEEGGPTDREPDGTTDREPDGTRGQPTGSRLVNRPAADANRPAAGRVSLPSVRDNPSLRSGSASNAKATRADDDTRQRAGELVAAWRATLDPPPQQPAVAQIQIAAKALREGWPGAELGAALRDLGPPISGAALDTWRRRQSNGAAASGLGPDGLLTDDQRAALETFKASAERWEAHQRRQRLGGQP